ncbi:PilN domain-containing protein [Salisediminibacterium beveridgei]|uniref:Fimbrial Assembly Family Protein n=1 Tax=Salisediminibacterium beveridgei TaxID=632773 RepID=A0A1D7QTP3_9BACI|nr:hypothetical protein [Salisediminibacterium beveridgei]AOM82357.1 Fimbrial Assembly Family Protein [Salisediminibacterium beveridgei]
MVLAVLLVILANVIIVYFGAMADREASELERERQLLEEQADQLETEISEMTQGEHQLLFDAIETVEGQVIPTAELLTDMVARMPEEGYMAMFDFVYPNQLEMSFYYLELPDVAYYLDSLRNSPYVEHVDVHTISGEEVDEAVEEDEDFQEAVNEDDTFWYDEFFPNYLSTYTVTLDIDELTGAVEEDPETEADDTVDEDEEDPDELDDEGEVTDE